jgi:hypothetical protein
MFLTLSKLKALGILSSGDSYLMVFAGTFDQRVCAELQFPNCEFTNVHGARLQEASVPIADARGLP